MAKTSDELASEAKEVLEQIVASIEIKDPDNTMSKSETPKMTKEKALIQKLQDVQSSFFYSEKLDHGSK